MRVVRVAWVDAKMSSSDWYLKSELELPVLLPVHAVSFGYEVESNDQYIKLAATRANVGEQDEQYCCVITIPRKSVLSIEVITGNA